MYKDIAEFLYTFYPVTPPIDNCHYHDVFVKTKKLTLVHYYEIDSRVYVDFLGFFGFLKFFFTYLGFYMDVVF